VTDDSKASAALAAQIEDLRGELSAFRAQWDAKLQAEGIGGTMTLLLEVKRLRERLDEALAKRQLESVPAPWWCVGAAEGKAMLAELSEWVEDFARRHYPGYMTRLPRCWASHPEAVWELSTLRAEWQRIYADTDNGDLQGALTWHDRWFPGVLGRLAASVKCDEAGCRVGRTMKGQHYE
jgi:hypothetical protein